MSTLDYYRSFLENWKQDAGPRPTIDLLEQVHSTGAVRPGSKDAFALAMALRDKGVTQSQIKLVLGAPHRNKLAQMVADGTAKRVPVQADGRETVYKITLTSKKLKKLIVPQEQPSAPAE